MSYLGIAILLAMSVLLPLSLSQPKAAHATSLPAYRYTKTFDTTGGTAEGDAVATDSSGNVYVTGSFEGTVVFDGVGGSDSQSSGGNEDGFITKYNPNGSYGWTKIFDVSAGGAYAWGQSIATDSSGNIYVTGSFDGTVVFDGVGGSDSQSTANSSAFITKYNANGSYGYTKIFDTSSGSANGDGIATDANGNIYTTGYFQNTVVFDGVGGSDSQVSVDGSSFLTKYNANGSYGYTKIYDTSGSSGYASGAGVATDSSGNIYVTGSFDGTVVFDGVGGSDSQAAPGSDNDWFLTKYNANGSYGYTKIFDNSAAGAQVQGYAIATDSSGNIYTTGYFQNTVVFDGVGGSDSQTPAGNNGDSFLTKYNANGSYGWTKILDNAAAGSYASGYGVNADSNGDIYVTGYFGGAAIIFDGVGGSDSQADPGGNEDSFLTKYNPNGSYGWTKIYDASAGGAYANGNGVTSDSFGNVYVTGYFQDTVVFDGIGGSDSQSSTNGSSFLSAYQAFVPSNAGPNGGDANNDGTQDYLQPYVTTVSDSVSNNYAVVQANNSCTNGSVTVSNETSNAVKDSAYSYPAGLLSFTTNCITHGFVATIDLYFYGQSSSGLVLRKYNATNHTYSTVPGATFSQITIAGQTVTKVVYQVTDGGSLDQDGTANGVIVDPVGIAKAVSAPNTGYGVSSSSPIATLGLFAISSLGVLVLAGSVRKLQTHKA